MSKTIFTDSQIAEFSENPYTYQVTSKQILFTKEFKELFWEEYKNGVPSRTILKQCGYDVDLLSSNRITGIGQAIRKEAALGIGFHDGKRPSAPSRPSVDPSNDADAIKQLRNEVEYLKQEMEFLKKTISVRATRK
jgi:hypothetical protein